MKKILLIAPLVFCLAVSLSGCAEFGTYATVQKDISNNEPERIRAASEGLKKIASALVGSIPSEDKTEKVASYGDFGVSVKQNNGMEWFARYLIAEKLAEAFKEAVLHRPVVIEKPETAETIGLAVAQQATGLIGIIGGTVAVMGAIRPAPNIQQTADGGGAVGGDGASSPSVVKSISTEGGTR